MCTKHHIDWQGLTVTGIHPHVSFFRVPFFSLSLSQMLEFVLFYKNQKAEIHSLPWTSSVPCFNCINIICMSWGF